MNKLVKIGIIAFIAAMLFLSTGVATVNAGEPYPDKPYPPSPMGAPDDDYDPKGEPVDEPVTDPIKGGVIPDPGDPK